MVLDCEGLWDAYGLHLVVGWWASVAGHATSTAHHFLQKYPVMTPVTLTILTTTKPRQQDPRGDGFMLKTRSKNSWKTLKNARLLLVAPAKSSSHISRLFTALLPDVLIADTVFKRCSRLVPKPWLVRNIWGNPVRNSIWTVRRLNQL